jgi:DNA-binding NtrC family response regulator
LVESTLFGHEKGAFTGAVAKALGKFREAEGGTLFLDEIGELPQDHQVKLLRALQEGEVEPVGLGKSVRVDVRIISATNRSLEGAVKEKAFRQDLLYRLNLLTLTLPPLRTRSKEDVHALAEHFLRTLSAEENSKVTSINEEALATLARYAWPGNIRELRNSIYRAILLCRSAILTPIDFLHLSHTNPYQEGAAVVPSAEAISLLNDSGEMRALAALEEEAIRFALEHYGWQMSKVARRLGIGRSTLYRRLDELSIISPESTQAAVHETSSHTG